MIHVECSDANETLSIGEGETVTLMSRDGTYLATVELLGPNHIRFYEGTYRTRLEHTTS